MVCKYLSQLFYHLYSVPCKIKSFSRSSLLVEYCQLELEILDVIINGAIFRESCWDLKQRYKLPCVKEGDEGMWGVAECIHLSYGAS